jgi:hypothetical protein
MAASSGTCHKIGNLQSTTTDIPAVDAALGMLTADCMPVHEPYAQAMWMWATGDDAPWTGLINPANCPPDTTGYGCVRQGAVPILVVMGDEPFAESYAQAWGTCDGGVCASCVNFPNPVEVGDAINAINGKFIAVGPTASSPEYAGISTQTGSVDGNGNPLLFITPADGTGIGQQVVEAIQLLAAQTPIDISAVARDLDDDGVDATVFIERIEANATGGIADPRDPNLVCAAGLTAIDTDGDIFPDTFIDVTPGTGVCFDIIPKMNTTVEPEDEPRIYKAAIDVLGDGITVLDTREVYFLVPPAEDSPIL